MPLVSRTRATLRSAEFGFFGVWVNTRVHTPRRCGEPFRAGVFDFSGFVSRPLRTSWAIVGTVFLNPSSLVGLAARQRRGHCKGIRLVPAGTRSEPTGQDSQPARGQRKRGGPP